MTTLTITAASILGLTCGAALESGKGNLLPKTGIVSSVVAAISYQFIIWNALDRNEIFIKSTLTVTVLAVVCSHLSLLALARLDGRFVWSRWVGWFSDWLLAGLILFLMWFEPEGESDIIFRSIAVLSIIVATVTVVTPVFHKLSAGEPDIGKIDLEIEQLKKRILELEQKKASISAEKADRSI
ncbi:MAG TPA: hypothetical protein PKD11_01960 [Pyrinomonadaceae bacterium]|nr:hypothetical protein [Pyrinomonadaceae bacterium]